MEVMITARYILQYTNLHRIEFLLRNVRLQLFHQDLIIIDKKLIITLRQNFISIKFESLSIFTNQTLDIFGHCYYLACDTLEPIPSWTIARNSPSTIVSEPSPAVSTNVTEPGSLVASNEPWFHGSLNRSRQYNHCHSPLLACRHVRRSIPAKITRQLARNSAE